VRLCGEVVLVSNHMGITLTTHRAANHGGFVRWVCPILGPRRPTTPLDPEPDPTNPNDPTNQGRLNNFAGVDEALAALILGESAMCVSPSNR
jgi:hypothetical protein